MTGSKQLSVLQLAGPKWRTQRRRLSEGASAGRAAILALVGVAFWGVLFAIIYRMLVYFRTSAVGDVLAVKLLGLVLLAFLSILLLSNIITALSSFFLARDLELLAAAPIDGMRIYAARLLETMINSSWMMVLVLMPILSAYGAVYGGGVLYMVTVAVTLTSYLVLPAVAGTAVTLLLVNVFPARRARDILALIALLGAAAMIAVFRLLRPEQLASPEGFNDLVDFIQVLETPQSVWLPSEWAAQAMLAPLGVLPRGVDFFPLLLLASTAGAFLVFGGWLHQRMYAEGFSRAQEGAEVREGEGARRQLLERALRVYAPTTRSLVVKDIRTFFRDTTQWSQLILLAVLVTIYIYNVRVLPLFSGEDVGFFLTNVVSFLNLGLAGFVLAAIAARFLFPAVSLEGRTLWLLRSSPLDLRRLLWSKYWVGVVPLLIVALALTLGTNIILRVSGFMMALSLITIALLTFGIASLALGFGALFPKFDTDNAAEISTGFGGLVFMMTATTYLGLVIMLEAWPVYAILQAYAEGTPVTGGYWVFLTLGLGGALLLSAVVISLPLQAARWRVQALDR